MRGASRWVQAGAPPANLRLKPVALKLCSRTAELHGTTQQPTCIALPGVHYHIILAAARQEALHSTRGTAPMAPKHIGGRHQRQLRVASGTGIRCP